RALPDAVRRRVTIAATFSAGIDAHDAGLALMHIDDAARLLGTSAEPDGYAIKTIEPMQVDSVQARLARELPDDYVWSNWAAENRSLFQAMAIEKTMMTIVLMFIVAVAAFNVVTSLMMVVNDKEKDIAILRTLGLEPERVSRIFLVQGALIGIIGTVAGLVLGVVVAANLETILPFLEQTFGFQIMPGDVFYVTRVPSELHWQDVVLIPSFALLIALLATVLPSRRAARIEPAEVLRYE
ncbi:MAG: FtsX-like permease family protein, partial [Gammaproteobacteria bacterium]|nr:FtsX-like permease family protein [Gammaproteobacteria bacterium]